MKRRQFLFAAAGGAALAGAARASVVDKFGDKVRPVDTMNHVEGWDHGAVKPLVIKNREIGVGRPKIIAPTTAKDQKSLIESVRKFAGMKALDMIEVRLDYLGKLTPEAFGKAAAEAKAAAGDKIVLVTLRNGTDGGGFVADDAFYEKANEAIIALGRPDIIDFELFRNADMIKRLVEKAHSAGTKVIISDHEFKFMPDEAELIRRLLLEEKFGADILKLAVMAHSPEDAFAIMSATTKVRRYYSNKPMLTMAMGKWGVLTRITGEAFGSDLTFASVGGKASAPGQIPAEDCETVLRILHEAMNPGA